MKIWVGSRSDLLVGDVLKDRAVYSPEKLAYSFLVEEANGAFREELLTFAQLNSGAESLAAHLVNKDLFQERAVLFFQPGLDYIQSFFACLRAGIIAMPAYPPRSSKNNDRNLKRLLTIIHDAQPKLAITSASLFERTQKLFDSIPALAELQWVVVDDILTQDSPEPCTWPKVEPHHIAFLQYTSGSTSVPKGVVVTQGNLVANEAMIQQAFGTDETTTCVGWLPLYHDMGLIGNVIQPIYAGFSCHLMAPTTFLRRPYLWLDAISRHRAVVSGGPNFAYALCTEKITDEQLSQLDLSSWRVAFNGSEPIRSETLAEFSHKFAACGFDSAAHYPCYGLAEATLMVSVRHAQQWQQAEFDEASLNSSLVQTPLSGQKTRTLVGSGVVCEQERVLIVSPDNRQRLNDGQIGEVWVSGDHIAKGYWGQKTLTEEIFGAHTSDTGEGPFMRTGDLGFFHEGELYITGRLKELIILRGRNHYPQDIEHTVQSCHEALTQDAGAAFSLEHDGEQHLVVVQEVGRTWLRKIDTAELIDSIRRAVAETHEIHLHAVVLIKPVSLPKTTSGKIRRRECRRLFEEGLLHEVGGHRFSLEKQAEIIVQVPSAEQLDCGDAQAKEALLSTYVQSLIAKTLDVSIDEVALDGDVASLGLDSLAAIELISRIADDLGRHYPLENLLEGPSPRKIAQYLADAPRMVQSGELETVSNALSINQSALWLLHQLMPESVAYLIPVAVRLRNTTSASDLDKALLTLAQRHPSLRTVFGQDDGQPVQTVLENYHPKTQVHDVKDLSEAGLRETVEHHAYQPMTLEQPPWRVHLFQTEEEQILLVVAHHLVSDMWSLLVFFKELGALLGAGDLGPLPQATYGHFVSWQKHQLAGNEGEKAGAYWQEAMGGDLTTLVLPTDMPRPAVQTHHGASYDFSIGHDLGKQVTDLANQMGTTSFTLLLSVWQVLLHRYSGQDDICVGSPTAGRTATRFNGVIGDFVNPVVFRGRLHGNPSFQDFLGEMTQTVRSGLAHASFPFELLVERICPNRDPSFSPVFQAMFSLQKTHALKNAAPFVLGDREVQLELGGLRLAPFALPVKGAQVDLALVVADDEALPARLVYNTDLFVPETVARIANHFRQLLARFMNQPTLAIDEAEMMSDVERHHLLGAWNQTQVPFDAHLSIGDLFTATASRVPEKTALIFGDGAQSEHMTYAQLEARSNQLAHQLRQRGVGPEARVGICLQRQPNLVVALLGVLKVGAAYVPLDPTHPESRTRVILEDAGVHLILTDSGPGNFSEQVTPLRFDQLSQGASTAPLPFAGDVFNLAYMIYTSGSTGRPKGVQLAHHSVVNFLQSMAKTPGIAEDDVMLAVTTISFDIAGLEIYLPLLTGAQLVLATPEEVSDGHALQANIKRNQVTMMQATPSTWRLLLEAGGKGPLTALCGGEALPGALSRDLLQAGYKLWNMYGPTETTIWSAVREITESIAETHTEPVGKPIANTTVHVCDAHGALVPPGVAGQLFLGGDGLARGYFNRPQLTALSFVPNPFASALNESRLYRTGDLVRLLPKGDLDFLGRMDYQVKLRGFRIEIGEIEAALGQMSDMREAVVTLVGKTDADRKLVAYLTLVPETPLTRLEGVELASRLRADLRVSLPDYMVPSLFIVLPAMPLTPNNKIDRKTLPAPRAQTVDRGPAQPLTGLEASISAIWKELLEVSAVGPNDNFFDLGGHSMLLSRANNRIKEQLDIQLSMVDMFQFPTVSTLANHIRSKSGDKASGQPSAVRKRLQGTGSVAIVGMACRFPGANDVDTFWNNLQSGTSALTTYSDDQLREAGVSGQLLANPQYVPIGAWLDDAETFDAHFFDFSPLDASLIDPQQRVFLEVCWHALESAGVNPDNYTGAVGVFAGSGMNTYLSNNLLTNPALVAEEGEYRLMTTNDKDFMATRVAYKLNLRGPAINLQTACSTSLVAVHEAANSVLQGECDMALAGGSTIRVPGHVGYLYRDGLVFSPDGSCRAFDKDAGGTVPGSGAGVVLLKRLEDAQEDGDPIIAVIKGSAINNDASQKVGYTAPGVAGQKAAISAAHAHADVNPETITYVEAHGTGTKMGDPIEIAALSEAFRLHTEKRQFCAVGSVKTNIGHLDTAAGVAGLIKTSLALKHGVLPPSLNFSEPNPEIDFEASPFYVNTKARDWDVPEGQPRRAGISSFGIGGTNVHMVLEEAPAREPAAFTQDAQPLHLVPLSARNAQALEARSQNLATWLRNNAEGPLAPVVTQLSRQKLFEHRRFALAKNREDLVNILETADPKRMFSRKDEQRHRGAIFLFPGQGAQYPMMSAQLYQHEPLFRENLDRCCDFLEPILGQDLRKMLHPAADKLEQAAALLQETRFTQPALFVVEYALARLLQSWGIRPRALMGHSIGEYVAATLAGVFTLEDALTLVAERGRLIFALPAGDMLSVPMDEAKLKPLLNDRLSIAAVNAPGMVVVSGDAEAVQELSEKLSTSGTDARMLRTSHAFHSYMMDPILEPFRQKLGVMTLQAPEIPVVSNLTGTWLTPEQATDPAYWADHLRGAVRFADGLTALLEDPDSVLVEVGPGRTLTTLARRHPNRDNNRVLINGMPAAAQYETEHANFLEVIGKLWLTGVALDWQHTLSQPVHLDLPAYPFQRQRFWIEPGEGGSAAPAESGKKADVAQWFYAPSWKRNHAQTQLHTGEPKKWLLFADPLGLCQHLESLLNEQGHTVIRVAYGDRFHRVGEDSYTLDPAKMDDLKELLSLLKNSGREPDIMLHLGNVTGDRFVDMQSSAPFFEAMALARAVGDQEDMRCLLAMVTDGARDVFGEGIRHPQKTMLDGVLKVLPQEHEGVLTRAVDIDTSLPPKITAKLLFDELTSTQPDIQVAYRGRSRWVRTYEAQSLKAQEQHPRLRMQGTYLITGGLGGVGLAIAHHLAENYQANLILSSRKGFPRDQWSSAVGEKASLVTQLQKMEAKGSRLLIAAADVTDESSLRKLMVEAQNAFGKVHGVIHAAGLPGGGAIAHREQEDMEKVLAPKVRGTLLLDRVFADDPPEFFALFSSVNALLGGFGQADYAAANAFLDAFAQSKADSPTYTFSINWDSWRSVGMAAAALEQASGKVADADEPTGEPVAYPLFDLKLPVQGAKVTYLSHFDVSEHWPLNEHWILDRAILPGTTYLEMARAALEDHTGQTRVTFKDVAFLAPLVVPLGTRRATRTVLQRKGAYFNFTVSSRQDDGQWRDHAAGQLHPVSEQPRTMDPAQITAQMDGEQLADPLAQQRLGEFHLNAGTRSLADVDQTKVPLIVVTDGKQPPQVSIELGRRWQTAHWVKPGTTSGMALLELAEDLRGDLDHYKLHPAILDFAVGYLRLFKNQASYLPLSYKKLTQFAPLPAKVYSYIRFAETYQEDRGNPIFDIELIAEDGQELVRIEGFALGRIDGARLEADEKAAKARDAEMAAFSQNWMSPEEGVEAFTRALSGVLPQLIVSTRDFDERMRESFEKREAAGAMHGAAFDRPVHPRPDLMNPYVAPRNQTEETLASIWSEVIGLEKVGIHDDFNDLGGDSLLITRIHARIKETFPTELSVAELMQYPNIADLTAYMDKQSKPAETKTTTKTVVQTKRKTQSRKAQSKMKAARKRNPLSRSGKK